MCVHVYVYVYVCVYVCACICMCAGVHTYVCITCVCMCYTYMYACTWVCAQIYQTARLCHDYINDFSYQCDETSGQSNLREEEFIWAPASETVHREGQLMPSEAGAAQAGVAGAEKKCSHMAPTRKPSEYSSQRRGSQAMSLNVFESQWL